MRSRTKVRSKAAIVVIFSAVFAAAYVWNEGERAFASAQGPAPSHTDAPSESNCTVCHTSYAVNSGTGSVTIAGLPRNYVPGREVTLTITTAQSDAVNYGFQLTALDSRG